MVEDERADLPELAAFPFAGGEDEGEELSVCVCISVDMRKVPPQLEDTALVGRLQYTSPPQPFLQAHEAVVANHEVIDQFDVQVLTCGDQLLRYGDIFWRGSGIATWVIMADDDGGAIAYDGGSIDFGGA